ncbi:MAG: hypothetical protein ACKVZJ_03525 [Phycisphaerales bacterium]
MRSLTKALSAAALIGAASASASASTSILSFTITNNTSQPWTSLLFELRPHLTAPAAPAAFEQVVFNPNSALHSTTRPETMILVNESNNKQLRFEFGPLGRMEIGQVFNFQVQIENPQDSAFRIVRIATPVPAPGAAALAGLAGVAALRRRR